MAETSAPQTDAGMEEDENERGASCITVPQPPSIEDFTIVKPISRGAFGKVYLGRKGGKLYAVKVVKKADLINKNMVHQVQAERHALALSKSPFIVHLFYSLQSANNVYLVMEYLIGGDVKSLLHICGYFDEEMAVKYISEVALALDYLHRHGIIHRDIKPDNMLISNDGHIKLTDFGLSRVTLNREINVTDILTTPSMSKPKQDYSRTPGQVLSLISSFGFNTPVGEKGPVENPSPVSADVPQLPQEFASPLSTSCKDYSVPSSNPLTACLDSSAIIPGMPIKSLTPSFLKFGRWYETSSAGSHSKTQLSSVESECCSSPRWEKDLKDKGPMSEVEKHEPTDMPFFSTNILNRNLLESDISPISSNDPEERHKGKSKHFYSSDISVRSCDVKDLVRKCVSEYKEGEEKLGADNSAQSSSLVNPNYHFSHLGLDNLKKEEETPELQNIGIKRGFEIVNTTPQQKHIQVKKKKTEYKRGCTIIKIPEKQTTSLTTETCCLELEGCMQESHPKESQSKDTNCAEENKGSKLGIPLKAKNLTTELNVGCEKDSFVINADEKLLESINMDSDLSLPEISATEKHLEKRTFSYGNIKDAPLEESKSEAMLTSPCCSSWESRDEPMFPVQDSKSLDRNQDKSLKYITEKHTSVHSSPGEMSKVLKKNIVAFRSYNSSINMSNMTEPSKISMASVEGMNISACSSSYPTTITPAEKGTPCRIYQTPQGIVDTPFRTPKSVRRGAAPTDGERILGTPEYLAPELLITKGHGAAVDWWALGVCLFEFLTGIPPFNDETLQQVFQNILKRDIPWPEGEEKLSDNAQDAIDILLTIDSAKRAGIKELKLHSLFHGVDWDNLHNQAMPFIPQPYDETDTSYFEARNKAQQLTVSGFSL